MPKKKKPAPIKQMANATPFSPYCEFTMKLRGFDIIERSTDRKLLKVAVWDRHANDPRMIEKLINRTTSTYKFIPHIHMSQKTAKI